MSGYLLYGDDKLRIDAGRARLEKRFVEKINLPKDQKELEQYLTQGAQTSLWDEPCLYLLPCDKDWPSKLVQKVASWTRLLPKDDVLLLIATQKIPKSHPLRKLKNLPWKEAPLLLPTNELEWKKYLQKRAKEKDVLLSGDLAIYILGKMGDVNPQRINNEIYKLALLEDEKIISRKVIDQVIISSKEIPGYLLNDPFVSGNTAKMLESATKLLADNRAPISMVMALARHLRRLASIQHLQKIHGTQLDITRHMQGHPYALRQWQIQARGLNPQKLEKALLRLAQLESELKGMDTRSARYPELLFLAGLIESVQLAH